MKDRIFKTRTILKVGLAVFSVAPFYIESLHQGGVPRRLGALVTTPLKHQAIAVPVDTKDVSLVSNGVRMVDNFDDPESWITNLDYDAFANDVRDLGKQLTKDVGHDDVDHLNKILRWRDLACIIGIATMWVTPNPLTIAALSTWTYASWTMIAHHTCHGGYNRLDAGKYNSRGFALGSIAKRITDWCDWMLPEAWNVEHNRLHHYHLGEQLDPDLVERNMQFLRDMDAPLPAKYSLVAALVPTWKWFYYAPNTSKELRISQMRAEKKELPADVDAYHSYTFKTIFFPENEGEKKLNELVNPVDLFINSFSPFLLTRYVLLPAPLLLLPGGLGPIAFGHAVCNLLAAELLTNIHAFATIVTNHAGDDLYKFDDEVKPKSASFYVRQVVSSVNYETGTDPIDFAHGWLNYQIEHHVWPDLSMLQYQKAAPLLKNICKKHGVPYIQESVWTRLRKTVDVIVGEASMKNFPTELEPSKDKALNGVTWRQSNGAIDGED